MAEISYFRKHWALKPGIAFLNHGSFGACPKPILALQQELRRKMEAEPVQFLWRNYEQRLDPARAEVAAFIGARSRDVVFVPNATTAVNGVLRSLKLRPGDELLTTCHDYNACRNALVQRAREDHASVVVAQVPFPIRNPGQAVEAVVRSVTRRTKLALIDHVTSSTGIILPVAHMIRELEARGVDTLVDGAHAPGMVPLNLRRLQPAYYAGNLHKWVCAPKGAAFFWAREDKQIGLQPAVVSHGNNTPRTDHTPFQDRFDWAGTFDPTSWLCAAEAIRWMAKLVGGGWPAIYHHNHILAVEARRLLCERLELAPPCPEPMLGAMVTLPLPERFQGRPKSGKIDSEQLRLYDEFQIEVPFFRFGQPSRRYFRISAQLYNSLKDYERLAEALQTHSLYND